MVPVKRAMRLALFLLAGSGAVAHAATPGAACEALGRLSLADTTITAAETVGTGQYKLTDDRFTRMVAAPGMNPAGQSQTPANPAFCRVALTLTPSSDSAIKTEVWLPLAGWNHKLLGVGNFGWGGALMTPGMLSGLDAGYVVASNDTGHDSSTPEGEGGRFALGHPQKLTDYAYRANHLMTVRAKEIIQAFYGEAASHAYWAGCSLGGLQGLIEASRYPADYDGIIVGAPPNPLVNFNAQQLWPAWLLHQTPAAQIPADKFKMVNQAVQQACASPVGRAQGFVDAPEQCRFAPRLLLCRAGDQPDCLTEPQVRLMEQIYQGPVNPRTGQVIFPGPAKGTEATWGGMASSKPFPTALDLFRYAVLQNPDWDWTTLDWDKDIATATAKVGPLLHVAAPDLQPFFERGGKLMLYLGWNDGHNPEELASFTQRVQRVSAKAADAVQLFLSPGMGHCLGGAGCDTFDKLGAMDAWVTRGQAPQKIVASKINDGKVVRTRPLCAYPQVAQYKGRGDMDDAANFACVSGLGVTSK